MHDDMEVRAQDLAIDELQELLEEAGAELSQEQTAELAAFIAEAGSVEDALDLLAQISQQRDAA